MYIRAGEAMKRFPFELSYRRMILLSNFSSLLMDGSRERYEYRAQHISDIRSQGQQKAHRFPSPFPSRVPNLSVPSQVNFRLGTVHPAVELFAGHIHRYRELAILSNS